MFDSNQLTTIPLIIRIANLRFLSISSNKLEHLNINLNQHYPYLEHLDLSQNSIEQLGRHCLTNTSSHRQHPLEVLNLSQNKIHDIQDNAFGLLNHHLKVLNLAGNRLTHLRKNHFGKLSSLKTLDLSHNKLAQIESVAFSKLSSLEVLKLRKNVIHSLEDGSFFGLGKLEKLNLDHNNITNVINSWTFGLYAVREMSLRHNLITTIEFGAWKPMLELADLNLAFNQLSALDEDDFEDLERLKSLKLANNQISAIDEVSFRQLTSLESLDLSSNEISWAIESSNGLFLRLESLKRLRLDDNRIKLIVRQTFDGLDKLVALNLSSNPISSIHQESFRQLDSLRTFHLKDANLNCDCSLRWFHLWLKANSVRRKFAESIVCQQPEEMSLKTRANGILGAAPADFTCQDMLKPFLLDDFSSIRKPILAIKKENLTFYCKAGASSFLEPVKFNWLKNKRIMNNTSSRLEFGTLSSTQEYENVTHYTNAFTIHNVQDDDQGEYLCMVSNRYGTVYSQTFQVNVNVVPYFLKSPQNITVHVGNTARLECSAKGQPSPIISWKKDGGDNFPAATERRMHVMPADDVFFIVEVKPKDMGLYTCTATNEAGFVLSNAYVIVYDEPQVVRKMPKRQVLRGTSVQLECLPAAGAPPSSIVWYKDEVPLKPSERHFLTGYDQLLYMTRMDADDSGDYSCHISNQEGTNANSFRIDVVDKIVDTVEATGSEEATKSAVAVYYHEFSMMAQTFFKSNARVITFAGIIILSVVITSAVWICLFRNYARKSKANQASVARNDEASEQLNVHVQGETTFKNKRLDGTNSLASSERVRRLFLKKKTKLLTNMFTSRQDTGIDESEGEEIFPYHPCNILVANRHATIMHRSMPRLPDGRTTEAFYSTLPRGLQYPGVANYPRSATIRSQRSVRNNVARYDSIREMETLYRTNTFDAHNPYVTEEMSEV